MSLLLENKFQARPAGFAKVPFPTDVTRAKTQAAVAAVVAMELEVMARAVDDAHLVPCQTKWAPENENDTAQRLDALHGPRRDDVDKVAALLGDSLPIQADFVVGQLAGTISLAHLNTPRM